jgi:hypothetical protein
VAALVNLPKGRRPAHDEDGMAGRDAPPWPSRWQCYRQHHQPRKRGRAPWNAVGRRCLPGISGSLLRTGRVDRLVAHPLPQTGRLALPTAAGDLR